MDVLDPQGYATEAAQACLEWGFATLDVDYFTAMIRPGNTPSVRVAERLGFSPLREDVLKGNPVTVYSLNRPALVWRTEVRAANGTSLRPGRATVPTGGQGG